MPDFEPRNADYDSRVRDSFNRQKVMHKLGVSIGQLAPGRIVLEMDHEDDLTQQHGFLHAGIVSTALFRFEAAVVKPGRTLTTCEARTYALKGGTEKLVAMMTGTLIGLVGRTGVSG